MKTKRKPISNRLRFEVFKRDSFTCQYCGKSSPDVILHVDHIKPVSKGGKDDILNLITSCTDCNLGKSNKALSDKTVLMKQKKQLNELSEKRNQYKLMIKWRDGLEKLDNCKMKYCKKLFEKMANCTINKHGCDNLSKWIKKYGEKEVMDAINKTSVYLIHKTDDSNYMTDESIEKSFHYIPRICECVKREKDDPELKEVYYIRGILRNRLKDRYYSDYKAFNIIRNAKDDGHSFAEIKDAALGCTGWNSFINKLFPCKEGE